LTLKKELDYLDWKFIGKLKKFGLHYLPKGGGWTNRTFFLSQMYGNRLSDICVNLVERNLIQSEVMRLLKWPSNYKIREGIIFIKSLNKYHSGPSASGQKN